MQYQIHYKQASKTQAIQPNHHHKGEGIEVNQKETHKQLVYLSDNNKIK